MRIPEPLASKEGEAIPSKLSNNRKARTSLPTSSPFLTGWEEEGIGWWWWWWEEGEGGEEGVGHRCRWWWWTGEQEGGELEGGRALTLHNLRVEVWQRSEA